jgi:hypothetical protein
MEEQIVVVVEDVVVVVVVAGVELHGDNQVVYLFLDKCQEEKLGQSHLLWIIQEVVQDLLVVGVVLLLRIKNK